MIGLAYTIGPDYLGLGVTADPNYPNQVSILSSFHEGGATYWSWWWKILFTAVTLSSGFKGGEVTPLFFIGAALGNTMARLMHAPVDLLAGLGFVSVFAGATNTPLACTIMGIELFATGQPELVHSGFIVYLSTACFTAYLFSGHSGIYLSQRIGTPKIFSSVLPPDISLRTVREMRTLSGSSLLTTLFNKNHRTNGNHVNNVTNHFYPIEWFDKPLPNNSKPFTNGEKRMLHKVKSREIGQICIYMTPREKRKGRGMKDMFAKPLYQEIIDTAKRDGILNAVAHHSHYGYSGNGEIQRNVLETPNSNLHLCIELIANRNQLELFCREHGDLLKGKIVVYKHMEHWDIHEHDHKMDIEINDAPQDKLDAQDNG